jgi:DNA-binding response OmpR family regulator
MSGPLILVAEDERDIRDLIVFTLQISGFNVVETPNGEEAVKKATELKPDLILMDVRMPKMTGYEACKVLKKQDATKDIPVVFLSAKGQETEINTGLEMGAVEYFLKPFAPDELAARVNKILAKQGKI